MYRRIIKNDFKNNKWTSLIITLFVCATTFFVFLVGLLTVNLVFSVSQMMEKSKTAHFLQMHSGDIDTKRISGFAEMQGNVEAFQILDFLNIDGSEIVVGNHTLNTSIQDNGFSTQSEQFDFLLDLNNEIISPKNGEIYVPLYYKEEINIGNTVQIGNVSFTVQGFLRDSEMQASIISSKRFLISENDFEKIKNLGEIEYLIEFRLENLSEIEEFETEYLNAGLESNGPSAITYSLFQFANALDEGFIIAVFALISLFIIFISFLCMRLTLLARIEEDAKEIAIMKIIGIKLRTIKNIYLMKYVAIAGLGCFLGIILAFALKKPLLATMQLYMGQGISNVGGLLIAAIVIGIVLGIVVGYVNHVLGRLKKNTASESARSNKSNQKPKKSFEFSLSNSKRVSANRFLSIKSIFARKKLYTIIVLIVVISSFLVILPQNIYQTITNPRFITNMGIGVCDIRIDIQQTDNIMGKAEEITQALEDDKDVANYTVLTSYMLNAYGENGSAEKIKVETGDHSLFSIEYSQGKAPEKIDEIALSELQVEASEKHLGDTIMVEIDGIPTTLEICGIYGDITNGGKTAKVVFTPKNEKVLWSVIPVSLTDSSKVQSKTAEFQNTFSFAKISDIQDFIDQSFGKTINAVQKTVVVSTLVGIGIVFLVTALFEKLMIVKDRNTISILKILGFKNKQLKYQYLLSTMYVLILGVVVGVSLTSFIGEYIVAAIISILGINSFHFAVNIGYNYLLAPLLIIGSGYLAVRVISNQISVIETQEYRKE